MKVQWIIDDGYINNAIHSLEIDDEELNECETEEEKEDLINKAIEDEFLNIVSWERIN